MITPTYNPKIGIYINSASVGSQSGVLGLTAWSWRTLANQTLGLVPLGAALAHANRQAYLGVAVYCAGTGVPNALIGLYIDALPEVDVPIAHLGISSSGLYEPDYASLGIFTYGYPNNDYSSETQGRLLVKANSDDTVDQDLILDAVTIFKGLGTSDFYGQLIGYRTAIAEFYAKLKINRYINPPRVQILQVNYMTASGEIIASGDPIPCFYEGARRIQVIASGTLGDGNAWSHAQIDFGEPWRGDAATYHSSISGFVGSPPWTADHVYTTSGNYILTARGVDVKGCVGSDLRELNLASGLVKGIDYPAISISGTPVLGDVPPSLQISFTTTPSGSFVLNNPTDDRIFWSFGNRESSKRKNPITYYASPGLYTPVCRVRYRLPSGQYIWFADSLRIGYNR